MKNYESSTEILRQLDGRAIRFEFPVLDNANVRFIAGRFRGLTARRRWAMVFEILVFDPMDRSLVADVYAYGPSLGAQGFRLIQVGGVDTDPEHPLWSANGDWIVGPEGTAVRLRGLSRWVGPSPRAPDDIVLQGSDLEGEVQFGRALVREVGFEGLVSAAEVNAGLELEAGFLERLRLADWDHPDVAGGQLPSASRAISAAARVLAGESEELGYFGESANLTSPNWASE